MASAPASFVWADGALVERELEPHDGLVAADSWFVTPDGRVRALDAHRARFADAVAGSSVAVAPLALDAFWGASMGRLRAFRGTALFPRVELAALDGRTELRLRVRVAPRRRETAVLMTYDAPDPRSVPRVKGPDLEHLIALRAGAQEDGADELVLLHDGLVVDCTGAALLWWRDDLLVAPSSDLARVDSVTARSIRLIATATGTKVAEERARPADLAGCELWTVSALHGISVVEGWIGGPSLTARPLRAATWNRRLEALRRPL